MGLEQPKDYWSQRYLQEDTPWNLQQTAPPLGGYFQTLQDREQRILIPGAGHGHEAAWLWQNGFKNTHVLDISPHPLRHLQQRLPKFPSTQLHQTDFFAHQGSYDLVVEQTFFCAIDPALREKYAQYMQRLLLPGGRLVGLFFDFPLDEGPPYGGSIAEYRALFGNYFRIYKMERCFNSIPPRQGNELFIHLLSQ